MTNAKPNKTALGMAGVIPQFRRKIKMPGDFLSAPGIYSIRYILTDLPFDHADGTQFFHKTADIG